MLPHWLVGDVLFRISPLYLEGKVSENSETGPAGAEAVVVIWTCRKIDVSIRPWIQACDGTNQLKTERPMDLFEWLQ